MSFSNWLDYATKQLTKYVEHKAYKSMVSRKRQEDLIYQDNMLEIVYHAFTIQKIHGGTQEVPIQGFCKSQASSFTRDIDDADDLSEGYDLNCGDEDYDVYVTG
jgi:hypothetical protein